MKRLLEYTLLGAITVLVVGSLFGALLDRPVFISYAYSGSMTPTISKGDVFFINPLARNPSVGDIIVFKLRNKWTVHRVVGITPEGYVTKGDNNIATDQQDLSSAAVRKNDIAGSVVTIGGKPIKIPGVGNYLDSDLSDRGRMLLGGLLIVLGIIAFTGGNTVRKSRGKRFYRIKFSTVYLMAAVLLLLMLAVSTFVSWQVISVGYSVTSAGGLREGWYLPGEEFQREITVKNNNFYPMRYYVSTASPVKLISKREFSLGPGEEKTVTIDVRAPMDPAQYSAKVRVNAYFPILPSSVMTPLYEVHPMMPLFGILGIFSGLLAVLYFISGIGNEDIIRIRRRRRRLTEVFRI